MTEPRRRKNVRLQEHDYSACGAYFVTICTYEREMFFGRIENGIMHHNEMGRIAVEEIAVTNELRKATGISITHYVVMPNHVHLIIEIQNVNVGTQRAVSENALQHNEFSHIIKCSVSSVVRAYKSAVTKRIRESCNTHTDTCTDRDADATDHAHGIANAMLCPHKVWQARYYDHIIRNENDHEMIKRYINDNPSKWQDDRFCNG